MKNFIAKLFLLIMFFLFVQKRSVAGPVISTQYMRDMIESKVPNCKDSRGWAPLTKILYAYADKYNEIKAEKIPTLISKLRALKTFSKQKKSVYYKILTVAIKAIAKKLDLQCPICLEKIENIVALKTCKHSMCEQCLVKWYSGFIKENFNHTKCPVCRKAFSGRQKYLLRRVKQYRKEHRKALKREKKRIRDQIANDLIIALQMSQEEEERSSSIPFSEDSYFGRQESDSDYPSEFYVVYDSYDESDDDEDGEIIWRSPELSD